ncbi:hypothetical protein TRIUR3_31350 [Triticum urartu]|uniref:Uncharacterized protein n=1 Tax=Triticum urartu TaxID=4572 RepID=M7Z5U6_TRIUA|nr:hypothetical protein TRIUR3_31350 [Triticum urartu]
MDGQAEDRAGNIPGEGEEERAWIIQMYELMQRKAAALEGIAEERRQVTAETRVTRDAKTAGIRSARLHQKSVKPGLP